MSYTVKKKKAGAKRGKNTSNSRNSIDVRPGTLGLRYVFILMAKAKNSNEL